MDNFQGVDGSAVLILFVVGGCAYLIARLGQWYAHSKKGNWIDIDPKVYRK